MSKARWLLSAGAFVFAAPAFAQPTQDTVPTQESPTEEGAVQDGDELQEGLQDDGTIVVTAQGRAQRLQDVPLAVSAIGQEQLQNSGATDIRALNQLAPSLLVSSTGSEANGSARIRGIGTVGDNPGLESSVAVFIDGVYRSRSGIGLNELGEVDRIEVLRGPQGTLFGRNASAGLIHIIPKRPSFTFGGMAELSYGNYDYIRAQGAITGPLSDTIAARLDAVYVRRDGFLDVVNPSGGTEESVNDRNRAFVRGQLLFAPNDALSVRLSGDYTWRDESCCGAVYYETRETIDTTTGALGDFAFSPNENRILTILKRQGAVLPSLDDPFNRLISITPGRTYKNETTDYGGSLHIDYDFGSISLASITAYRGYKSYGAGDFDYGTVDIIYRAADDRAYREFKTLTQEIRLNGTAFDDRLDWLIGGYFANEDLELSDNIRFGTQYGPFAACRAAAGSAATVPLLPFLDPTQPACLTPTGRAVVLGQVPGTTPAFGPFTPAIVRLLDRLSGSPALGFPGVRDVGDVESLYFQNSRNFALFTHNIFNVTDELSLTLGLRYTHESKEFSADFNNNNTVCPAQQAEGAALLQQIAAAPIPAAQKASLSTAVGQIVILTCTGNSSSGLNALNLEDEFDDGELSGTAVVTWRPSQGNLFYGSYSRGFKAGGYNLDRSDLGSAVFPRTNADAANLRFAPEIVDAFEIGAKITRSMFTFNVAAFHQRFRDFQLNTFNGLVFIVQNVNGCGDLIGGSGADEDASAVTGACAPEDVKSGVTSTGVELEAMFQPSRDLTVTAGYTFVQTRYDTDLVGSSAGEALDPALFLLAGDNLSNAPEHVATASVSYTPEIGNSGITGLFYLDGRFTSDFNTGSDLFPEKEQESFVVVNGRIGIRGPDQRWALEIWGQNLTDEDFTQVAFNLPFQGAGTRAQVQQFGSPSAQTLFGAYLGEPRTYGITGRVRF